MRCMSSLFMHVIIVARVSNEIPQEFKINKNIGNTTSNAQYAKGETAKANNKLDKNSSKNTRNAFCLQLAHTGHI